MHIIRTITRLPGGFLRCLVGAAAAAVALIGLAGRLKPRVESRDVYNRKPGKKEGP